MRFNKVSEHIGDETKITARRKYQVPHFKFRITIGAASHACAHDFITTRE